MALTISKRKAVLWAQIVSIPYSQVLRVKRICSETSEVIKHFKDRKDAFIMRDYQFKIPDHHLEKAMNVDRKIL